jgi:hypothetical protein
MKIFFVFLCFIFISSHAVYAKKIGPLAAIAAGLGIGSSSLNIVKHGKDLHRSSCCNIFNHRCCCKMYHGGIGKFHSWSSDFRNVELCVDKGGCDLGWKC